ncbi:MAG: RidA family protein [Oligoflexia bacterium]|nr:RidA family protein [Oligoflexia bacterium]
MGQLEVFCSDNAPAAIGPYSPVVTTTGKTYFFSGQLGINPQTGQLQDGFTAQLAQTLNNIDALLSSADLNRSNIVKTTIYLTDLSNFSTVNAAYQDYFQKPFPARSCVEVKGLPKNALVEIEVIAIK